MWADGLGNWKANSLPICQLRRLQDHVAKLQEIDQRGREADSQPLFRFWIDTLCCPVEASTKKLALGRIADTYRHADYILVLDRELVAHPISRLHPAESVLRILFLSNWVRRLWTLQGS